MPWPSHGRGPAPPSSANRDRGIFDVHTGARSISRGKVYYLYDPLGAAAEWKRQILAAVGDFESLQLPPQKK
jgi:hypothetical protein